jgi:hypothetical protein
MIFNTIEELLTQAEKDDACEEGLEWAEKQSSLEDIIHKIPHNYRYWCLMKGYEQFSESCDWSLLSGDDWSWLLRKQSRYADKCNWNLLSGRDWSWLLRKQPQFHDKCDWSLLNASTWSWLLLEQPQLKSFRIMA